MKSITQSEVIPVIISRNKDNTTPFVKYISDHFDDETNTPEDPNMEYFTQEDPDIEYLDDTSQLTNLQQRVIDYFKGGKSDDPESICKSEGLDFNPYTKKCCPNGKKYNPNSKRCKSKKIDHNGLKQKSKSYCSDKNLEYNEHTKKCCKVNQVYNPTTKRCKKDTPKK